MPNCITPPVDYIRRLPRILECRSDASPPTQSAHAPCPTFTRFTHVLAWLTTKNKKGGFDDDIRLRWSPHQNNGRDRFVGHGSAAGLRAGPEVSTDRREDARRSDHIRARMG